MKKTQRIIILICALFLATLACRRTSNDISTATPTLPVGESTRTLTHDGRERSYILYVPDSVNWQQPIPLVFVFHGGTGNAKSAIRTTGFNEVANQNGFILVYPDGTGRFDNVLFTWNGGNCCGYAQENTIDDVGFVRLIVTELQNSVNIDSKRIYATGLSNGGILSQRLACEASDIFAAIAPVSGTLNFPECAPANSVSIIEFHGTDDQHIPYNGGKGPESLVDVSFVSVQDTINFWISHNKCATQPETSSFEDIQLDVWKGCATATSVVLYTIIGGGHSWPGGSQGWPGSDQPNKTISASQLIWEFFATHPKQ